MDMQKMIEFEDRLDADYVGEEELEAYLRETADYLNQKSEQGMKIILSKMKEEDFTKMVRGAGNLIVSGMNSEGFGDLLNYAKLDGSFELYTHTIILSVLAILADEEVI
jgi:hypothetical protein